MDRSHQGTCVRCGAFAPGSEHLHLPKLAIVMTDLGFRFYCERCWRRMVWSAAIVIGFGVVAIGGLALLIFVATG